MKFRKHKYFLIAFALILLASSYNACSPVRFMEQEESTDGKVTPGDGHVYTGKPYYKYGPEGACGYHNLVAEIRHTFSTGDYVLVREDCVRIDPIVLDESSISFQGEYLVYEGESYAPPNPPVANSPPEPPPVEQPPGEDPPGESEPPSSPSPPSPPTDSGDTQTGSNSLPPGWCPGIIGYETEFLTEAITLEEAPPGHIIRTDIFTLYCENGTWINSGAGTGEIQFPDAENEVWGP